MGFSTSNYWWSREEYIAYTSMQTSHHTTPSPAIHSSPAPCLKEDQSHTFTLLTDSCASDALWRQPLELFLLQQLLGVKHRCRAQGYPAGCDGTPFPWSKLFCTRPSAGR